MKEEIGVVITEKKKRKKKEEKKKKEKKKRRKQRGDKILILLRKGNCNGGLQWGERGRGHSFQEKELFGEKFDNSEKKNFP